MFDKKYFPLWYGRYYRRLIRKTTIWIVQTILVKQLTIFLSLQRKLLRALQCCRLRSDTDRLTEQIFFFPHRNKRGQTFSRNKVNHMCYVPLLEVFLNEYCC